MDRRIKPGYAGFVIALIVLIQGAGVVGGDPLPPPRRVYAPHFAGQVWGQEMAVLWLGRIDPTQNAADVRVGYNDAELNLRLAVFDRRLWYDTQPVATDLSAWDAATVYLDLDGNTGSAPGPRAYRLVAQLNQWEPRAGYQAAYRGNGSTWVASTLPFTATTGWRGNAPNDSEDDRGWTLSVRVRFADLGLGGPPPDGAAWGLAVVVHDRDDAAGTAVPIQTWPESVQPDRSVTWGQLVFGLPTYTPPPATAGGSVTVRQGLNGAIVPDGDVGGHTNCCAGLDFWSQCPQTDYSGTVDAAIANQSDVADWPCFSRYYVTFPLGALPPGKVVLSATLTLHQFGNAGGGSWGEPGRSYIQVLSVAEDWQPGNLTWNSAPRAVENVSAAWVDPLAAFPGWPGAPRSWDVSRATAQAYAAGQPLRLALYSADTAYHSGKYFVSSNAEDWNAAGRPALNVTWGEPPSATTQTPTPTRTPTATRTPSRTPTPTQTPSRTPTVTRTPSRTPTPTPSRTPTVTRTPSSTLTPTRTPSRTPTPTRTPVRTPTAAPATPTPTPMPTAAPTTPAPEHGKRVSQAAADYGDVLAYTITLAGNGGALALVDRLPDGLELDPASLTCHPHDLGTLSTTPGEVRWSGSLADGESVELSYCAVVQAGAPAVLVNNAVVQDALRGTSILQAATVVNGHTLYLPVVLRR